MKNSLTKEMKILLISVAAITLIGLGVYALSSPSPSPVTNTANDELVRDFNHKTGPDNARVKIVEFYDPECEACAAFFPFVKEMINRYPNDIQLTVRYALYHGNSALAAKASEAAALQNKFWEFQELLFIKQEQWSHKHEPATAYFEQYAQELDLDLIKFRSDMSNSKIMDNISIDIADGKTLGVNGTPTFFINGQQLETLHPDAFREKIQQELK